MYNANIKYISKINKFSNYDLLYQEGSDMTLLNKAKYVLSQFHELGIFLVLVVLCLAIGIANPTFWGLDNIMNILRSSSYLIIIAIGQCAMLLLGAFDMSAGNVMGFGGIICAYGMNKLGMSIVASIVLGLLVGAMFGLFNGFLVVYVRIPAFIATLGAMYIAKGLTNVITEGRAIYPLADGFGFLGNYDLFGFIPLVVVIMLGLLIVSDFVIRKTVFGRQLVAIGGNPEVAKLSGINCNLIRMSVFVFMGVCSALSGIIVTSRMESGQTHLGSDYALLSIAACLIGGTSTAGGIGSMPGTLIGALIMSVLTNGMVLVRINTYWQSVVLGAILILAVALDLYNRRKTGDLV